MSAHTPAPWHVESEDAGDSIIVSESRPFVATVHFGAIPGMTEANARLIAAAPELLSCAERSAAALMSAGIEPDAHSDNPLEWLLHETVAAIAKATGGAA